MGVEEPAKLAAALRESGHEVSPNTVAKLLETKLEYSRQVNRKTHEGAGPRDICGTALRASDFFRRFIRLERCGHMYGLSARSMTAGLDEVRDARG